MNSNKNILTSSFLWRFLEIGFIIVMLIYFMIYPRDTLSDFIVLTILCLIVFLLNRQLGLKQIEKKPFSKLDWILAVFSSLVFISAWMYGIYYGKVNWNSALTSIGITATYFYYAFIQHYLAQKYLAIRMLQFSQKINKSKNTVLLAALLTGIIFSLLHIVYTHLMLPAAFIGVMFTYYYLSTGRFWAVVCAHAMMASSLLFWCLDDHPFTEIIEIF